jgi:hypothetical protein
MPAAPLRSFGEAGRQFPKLGYILSAGTRHCERSEAALISDMSMSLYSIASIAETPC